MNGCLLVLNMILSIIVIVMKIIMIDNDQNKYIKLIFKVWFGNYNLGRPTGNVLSLVLIF